MATINPVIEETSGGKRPRYLQLFWETVNQDDQAASIDTRAYARRISRHEVKTDQLVMLTGTFSGATFTVEQSLDNTNWFTAKNPSDTDLSFTSAGIGTLRDDYPYLRVQRTSGTSTDVDIRYRMRVVEQ